jgi:hypothetical protein
LKNVSSSSFIIRFLSRFLGLSTIFSSLPPLQGRGHVDDLPMPGKDEAELAGCKRWNAFSNRKRLVFCSFQTAAANHHRPSLSLFQNSRQAPVEKRLEPAGLDALEHGLLAVRLLEEGDDGVAARHGERRKTSREVKGRKGERKKMRSLRNEKHTHTKKKTFPMRRRLIDVLSRLAASAPACGSSSSSNTCSAGAAIAAVSPRVASGALSSTSAEAWKPAAAAAAAASKIASRRLFASSSHQSQPQPPAPAPPCWSCGQHAGTARPSLICGSSRAVQPLDQVFGGGGFDQLGVAHVFAADDGRIGSLQGFIQVGDKGEPALLSKGLPSRRVMIPNPRHLGARVC